MRIKASLSRVALASIVVAVVVVAVVGGYVAYRASSSNRTVTLVVVTYNGINTVLDLAAQEFMKLHPGVKVEVISYPWSTYVENELTVLKAGSPQYDIVTFTPTSSQLLFPYLEPINSSDLNTSDMLWGQEAFGGVEYVNGTEKIMGVAIQTWVELLVYNATLFNNATIQREFQQEYGFSLSPWNWTSWWQVVNASSFFVTHGLAKYGIIVDDNPSHGIIDTYPAIFWRFWTQSNLSCGSLTGMVGFGTMFYGCIPSWWNHQFPPPAFNSTAGVEALEVMAQLVRYEPSPTQLIIDYDKTDTLLSQGGVAGAVAWANDILTLSPQVQSQLLMAPLPGGYGEPGSTFLAISKYSQHKQLALEFIEFVVSPQFQEQAFYEQGSLPVSKQALQEIASNASMPAYWREWVRAIMVAAQNSYATPPTVPQTYPYLIPTFNGEVFDYLTGQVTNASQALQAAALEWVRALEGYNVTATTSTS